MFMPKHFQPLLKQSAAMVRVSVCLRTLTTTLNDVAPAGDDYMHIQKISETLNWTMFSYIRHLSQTLAFKTWKQQISFNAFNYYPQAVVPTSKFSDHD